MKTAYIGIGSNMGDKQYNCIKAVDMIGQISGCELTGRSDWYLTRPVGVNGQDWYVNGVISIATPMSAQDLLDRLMTIEADMGRVRRRRWESRIIDLDILIFGEEIMDERDLKIPHPFMHLRKFVLAPMVQLEPGLIHPSFGVTMAELLREMPKDGQVVTRIRGE